MVSDAEEPDLVMSLAVDLSLDIRLGDEAADLLLELVELDLVSFDRRARISRDRCERKLFFTKEEDELELTLAEDAVRLIPEAEEVFALDGPSLELLGPLGLRLLLACAELLLAARESMDFGPFARSLNMTGLDFEYDCCGFSRFVSLVLKYSW